MSESSEVQDTARASDPAPDGQPAAAEAEAPAAPAPAPLPAGALEATAAPAEDPELEDVEPAAIDQPSDEADTPFDKLASRAKRFSPERIRTVLEALLFVSDRPLTLEAMRQITGIDLEPLRAQLEKLQGHYRDGVRGIVLHEVAGGWQLRTDASASEFVRRFLKVKPQRLTRAALETLAIIAYRQPVTRPEIEDVRAVDCGAVLKALLERRLIKIIGKKEEVGRPLLYGTTPEFLEFFNLKDLSSLPTLREFHELSEESQAIVEKETGAPAPSPEGLVAALKDPGFEAKLAETNGEADAALADLETAMADSEARAKATAQILEPAAPEGGAPAPADSTFPDPSAEDEGSGEG